ncbi:MAG: NUDIX domain-containing protein [Anaerolineae bacterium]|nr:NUDIX domain-containing protein [Anaerolineae bacterium]
MSRLILFVCDGNVFRSVAALAFARRLAVDHGVAGEYRFNSAGIYGLTVGFSPDPTTVAEMARYGLDISSERARKLSAEEAHAASLIVTMDRQQQALIAACFGVALERMALIYDLIGENRVMRDIDLVGSAAIPRRVAEIRRCLNDGWWRLIDLANRDVPVWAADPGVADDIGADEKRIRLRPLSMPGNLPCSWGGSYQYVTTAPDPRPEPRWSHAGARVTLPGAGLTVDQVALEGLPRIVHVSSGGVVYRKTAEGVRFALSQRIGETHWELPVGTVEGRETLRQTAARELAEETGRRVCPSRYVHYAYDAILNDPPKPKVKHYFLAEATASTPEGIDPQVRCAWLLADEALSKLSWEERGVFRMALAQLENV